MLAASVPFAADGTILLWLSVRWSFDCGDGQRRPTGSKRAFCPMEEYENSFYRNVAKPQNANIRKIPQGTFCRPFARP